MRPHALTQVQVSAPGGSQTYGYGYDNAGNTTTRRSDAGNQQTLTFDPEGRLASLVEASDITSYVYDAAGNRLIRRDPTGATLYLPGGTEVKVPSGTSTGSATRYYTHKDATIAVRNAAGLSWIVGDHHGSPELTVNATSLAVAKRRSLPYGQERGTTAGIWAAGMDKGFVSGTTDVTGLTHLGAREYDPAIGRFVSVDPILDLANPQQWQSYAYANNNPITFSDPSGLIISDFLEIREHDVLNGDSDPHTSGQCVDGTAWQCQENMLANSKYMAQFSQPCATVVLSGKCLSMSTALRQANLDNGSTQFALGLVVVLGSQSDCMVGGQQIIRFGVDASFQGRPMTIGDVLLYPGSEQDFYKQLAAEEGQRRGVSNTCNSRGKCLDGDYYGLNLLEHEANHSDQWVRRGSVAAYATKCWGESLASMIRCGDFSSCNNYETLANAYQGDYKVPPLLSASGEFVDVNGNLVNDINLHLRN